MSAVAREPRRPESRDTTPPMASGGAARRPRRRRWTALITLAALALVAVTTLSAYLVGGRGATRYGARAEILYTPADGEVGIDTSRMMATQKAVAQSTSVLGPAARATGTTLDTLERRTDVETDQSTVLTVQVSAPTRRVAVERTGAVVRAYLRAVRAQRDPVAPGQAFLQHRLARLQAQLRTAQRALARTRGKPQRAADLRARIGSLLQRVVVVERSLDEVRVPAGRPPSARVLTAATELQDPVAPRPRQAIAVGALAGILLAAAMVLALMRLGRAGPG